MKIVYNIHIFRSYRLTINLVATFDLGVND